jgi:hypothetical protein
MFRNAEYTPVAAVASAGTFTVAYPTDTTAGDFALYGHKMFSRGHQVHYTQDAGQMSVSFGASDITVTYRGTTPLPANKGINLQFNTAGEKHAPASLVLPKRAVYAPLLRLDLGAPDTADADGILESQDLTAAGVFSVLNFNGVYGDPYANAYAVLDVPRNVVAAWTTAAVLTITGEDEYGDVVVEKSASGTSLTGKKAFKKITGIATSVNITGLTVGTGNVLGLPVYIERASQIVAEIKDGVAMPREPGKVYINGVMLEAAVDAGTAHNIVSPVAGRISKVTTIASATITTGGAITVEVNTVAVDGLSVVVADGSSEGDVDSDVPTAGHATAVVAIGDRIELIPAAGFNASADLYFIVEFETTGAEQLQGTFIAGVQTTPTATTGDVRGTYTAEVNANGSLQFALLAWVPDPAYLGVDNYDG